MFLTETVNNKTVKYDEAKIEPGFLYEAVLEANEQYHDICMKMIKCEHHCIVTEDAKMLSEAEEEAKRSFKEVIVNLLKKIKEALVNFKNFMVAQLAKLGKMVARVVSAPVRGVIAIVGGIRTLRQARKDIEAIISWNGDNPDDWVIEGEYYEEAEDVAGEAVDAKQAVNEAKGIFEKLKVAVSKLNFLKSSAEKAANEGDEHQAKAKLAAISSKISKAFAKVRNAFKVATMAVWNAMKTAGKAVADTSKKAAGAVKAKVGKKAPEAVAESVETNEVEAPEIFLEDMLYFFSANDSLTESTNVMTPVYLLYQSYTGHSMRRYAQLEDSFNKMKNEGDRRRLKGRIRRSIASAEKALDTSNLGQVEKLLKPTAIPGAGIVKVVAKNLPACKRKTNEYLEKLRSLLKKVEEKKF